MSNFNINQLNQNNFYDLGKPQVDTIFSALRMNETNTSTGEVGKMIPYFIRELQPNQKINLTQSVNVQFTPFVTNILHQMGGETVSYFVPYRLLWDEWEKFITGGEDGMQEPPLEKWTPNEFIDKIYITEEMLEEKQICEEVKNYIKTKISLTTIVDTAKVEQIRRNWNTIIAETTWDYAGLPNIADVLTILTIGETNMPNGQTVIGKDKYNALNKIRYDKMPVFVLNLKAINKIYNDWVRLMDWEPEREEDNISTPYANKNWDYFTRARRYQIRGAMPTIPVNPFIIDTTHDHKFAEDHQNNQIKEINLIAYKEEPFQGGYVTDYGGYRQGGVVTGQELIIKESGTQININNAYFEFSDLMTAAALMNYYSANSKVRPRYAEQLFTRWRVNIQDARLQLAEYLGGQYLNISSQAVVQTAGGAGTGLGDMSGQQWANIAGAQTSMTAQEHGVLISFLIVKPQNVYEQGYPALWQKDTKFDFATPEFANLPDVPIKKNELVYYDDPNEILGYKSIYDEYRTTTNKVTGLMRPSNSQGLSTYTLAKQYGLDDEMQQIAKCEVKKLMKKIKQYTLEPDFLLITQTTIDTALPLPYQSDPEMAL